MHIKVWITVAGAWAGAAKLMRIYASGTNLGFPDVVLEPLNLRPVLRTYESTAFLLPSRYFWSPEEVGITLIGVLHGFCYLGLGTWQIDGL